ncbi:MAG: hypothetical protein P8Q92_08415 [Pseudoprimorskyibacter sp.]|nr:hypothetical protein [Pseudoprimorskyibacter sp.]
MTHNSNFDNIPSLGVGQILARSFSIYFDNFLAILTLCMIPALLSTAPIAMLQTGTSTDGDIISGFSVLLSVIGNFLAIGMVVQLTYDKFSGRHNTLGAYFSNAFRVLIKLVLFGILVSILAGIGTVFLVLPGLYIAAMFYVVSPVILMEPGVSPLARSLALTKSYRWPLVGLMIVVFIISIISTSVISGGLNVLFVSTAGPSIFLMTVSQTLANAIFYGFGGVVAALVYARLRELKEGLGIEDMANVFE